MTQTFTAGARRFGIASAIGTVLLSVLYVAVLVPGFLSLKSPSQPIGDPWFAMLEILIILSMPAMVALMVAVNAWAPAQARPFSQTALVFMSLTAGVTSSLHFVLLAVGRQAAFAGREWMPLLLSFEWPSVPYALDILAWDVFFPLSVLFAAPVFGGGPLANSIRLLLVASGTLAFAGLSGLVVGDMQWRNIGIVGYAGVFPIAALLLSILFYRTVPQAADRGSQFAAAPNSHCTSTLAA